MKKPLTAIFFTILIYLIGFGMILPILPLLSSHYGATPFQAGLLTASYSLMQFLFSPFWGHLSDKYGRRPILMYCLLGEILAYIFLANTKSLDMLFVGRILTGFFAASISTATAYVSDVTTPQERSKGMGLIGAAFGLGFVVGPLLGGILIYFAKTISVDTGFLSSFTFYGVAALCSLTFVFAYFKLDESLKIGQVKTKEEIEARKLTTVFKYFKSKTISPLMLVFAVSNISMTVMTSVLALFMNTVFQWDTEKVSWGFAYIGLMIVFSQGFLVRKLIPIYGERILLTAGLFLMGLSFFLVAIANDVFTVAVSMTILGVGNSLSNSCLTGSISLLVPENEQGLISGATQSMSSLGRVVGAIFGGYLFIASKPNIPFIASCLLMILTLIIISRIYKTLPNDGKKKAEYNTGTKTDYGYINKIGFYQFDNLVQGRIPFMFLNLSKDVSSWYNSIQKIHVETYQVCLKEADIEQELASRQIPLDFAILVLCDDGQKSEKIAQNLHKKGYTNVYMIDGGYQQMMTDRKNL